MDTKLSLEYVGQHWGASGTLYWASKEEGDERYEARVYVDDIGETWCDVRRVPEGGFFASEHVYAQRILNGAHPFKHILRDRGYTEFRTDRNAHRVRERDEV